MITLLKFEDITESSIFYFINESYDYRNVKIKYYNKNNINDIKLINVEQRIIELTDLIYNDNYSVEFIYKDQLEDIVDFRFLGKQKNIYFKDQLSKDDNLIKSIVENIVNNDSIKTRKQIINKLISFYQSAKNKEEKEKIRPLFLTAINDYNILADLYSYSFNRFSLDINKPWIELDHHNYVPDDNIDIEISSEKGAKKYIKQEKSTTIYMPVFEEDLYTVNIFEEDEIIQTYLYYYFNKKIADNQYAELRQTEERKKYYQKHSTDIEDFIQNNNNADIDINVINILNDFFNDRAFFPVPNIRINKNNLSMDFFCDCFETLEEADNHNKNILSLLKSILTKKDLYLFMSEADQLYDDKADYRKIKLNVENIDNGIIELTDSLFLFNLNYERYYFWIGTKSGEKITSLFTYDPTGYDRTDYNNIFAKYVLKKYLHNINRIEENEFIYDVSVKLLDKDDIFCLDKQFYLLNEIGRYSYYNEDIHDKIYKVLSFFLTYYKKIILNKYNKILYKPEYKTIITPKDNNGIRINMSYDVQKRRWTFCYEYDYKPEVKIKDTKYNIFQFIDIDKLETSDFIMFYKKDKSPQTMYIKNTIEVEVLNGL